MDAIGLSPSPLGEINRIHRLPIGRVCPIVSLVSGSEPQPRR